MYTLAFFHCAELLNQDGKVHAKVYTQNDQEWDDQTVSVDRELILRREPRADRYMWIGAYVIYTPLEHLDMTSQELLTMLGTLPAVRVETESYLSNNIMYLEQKCQMAGFKSVQSAFNCLAMPEPSLSQMANVCKYFNTLLPFGL